jgi:hypothetical protein
MATTTTNYGFDVPTSSDLVKNGATAISTLGQDLDTFLFRPFTRNTIINGAFDIWARGTSGTANSSASGSGYNADRWQNSSSNAITVSRQATGDTTNLPNIQYCARFQRDSGQTSTSAMNMFHTIETSNSVPLAGKQVTLSFYARAGANYSSASNNLTSAFYYGTGTDQVLNSFTGLTTIASQNNTLTTTWQRFTVTSTVGSTATEIGLAFFYTPSGTAGANDYFEITGVQLEVGNQVTPFTRAGGTIQGELAACQRYYFRSTGSNNFTYHAFGAASSTTNAIVIVKPPVTMRTTPSGTIDFANLAISDAVATTVAVTAVGYNGTENPNNAVFGCTVASGLTANRPYWLINNNNAAGYIGFSAEL